MPPTKSSLSTRAASAAPKPSKRVPQYQAYFGDANAHVTDILDFLRLANATKGGKPVAEADLRDAMKKTVKGADTCPVEKLEALFAQLFGKEADKAMAMISSELRRSVAEDREEEPAKEPAAPAKAKKSPSAASPTKKTAGDKKAKEPRRDKKASDEGVSALGARDMEALQQTVALQEQEIQNLRMRIEELEDENEKLAKGMMHKPGELADPVKRALRRMEQAHSDLLMQCDALDDMFNDAV